MRRGMILFAVVAVVFMVGCSRKPAYVPITERAAAGTGSQEDARVSTEADKRAGATIEEEELLRRERERTRLAEEALKKSPFADFLFDFDSYTIKTEYLPLLKNIGDWMKQSGSTRITVEGNCDERGTTEYNLALGQKRADAVRDYLDRLGVDGKRVKTVSYGKETPRDANHTEEAWARNRRVHFKPE